MVCSLSGAPRRVGGRRAVDGRCQRQRVVRRTAPTADLVCHPSTDPPVRQALRFLGDSDRPGQRLVRPAAGISEEVWLQFPSVYRDGKHHYFHLLHSRGAPRRWGLDVTCFPPNLDDRGIHDRDIAGPDRGQLGHRRSRAPWPGSRKHAQPTVPRPGRHCRSRCCRCRGIGAISAAICVNRAHPARRAVGRVP